MKESEKIGFIYEQKVQKEKYPSGFSPVVGKLSLNDVVEGSWNLREEDGKVFVDVEGSVDLFDKKLKRIPWNFGVISEKFDCSHNLLQTLKGVPEEVGGGFYCFSNQLKTLEGAPKKVSGNFDCSHNKDLKTLEGFPVKVGGHFYCSSNQLKTLKGAPGEVGKDFYCYDNQLKNLKGAPRKVGGKFDCSYNQLQSLEGAPVEVGNKFDCTHNLIEFTEEDIRRAQIQSRIKNNMSANNRERFSLDTLSNLS